MFSKLRSDIACILERDPAARSTWEVLTCYPGLHAIYIHHGMGVVIGETAEVGNGCTIYQGVTLGGTSLYPGTKRHPTLGAGVIVGAGAKILGGFTVGDGARIGANSVVVKQVPAGATVVGLPARVVESKDAEHAARFAAYAVVQEQCDPHAKASEQLGEHSY